MRCIVLDTETTGLNRKRNGDDVCVGHRVIEIGCIEIVDRVITGRQFHAYIKPNRLIDIKATVIHGITDDFLKDKPVFSGIADEFLAFIRGAVLIIHNAPFDVAFIDQEFRLLSERQQPNTTFSVIDTLDMARGLFPGKKNDLDALCDRYNIEGRHGTHGALLDVGLLAKVYLEMTATQTINRDRFS